MAGINEKAGEQAARKGGKLVEASELEVRAIGKHKRHLNVGPGPVDKVGGGSTPNNRERPTYGSETRTRPV
ncbi:hypothetical protein GCM10023184_40820 [Flaviaesturariibacter amylovorans]|uniref:Uncharacterized protein n=1 Tax=Flaviaesturariibacter amylovorans TaxID=1084520 RepID=A0ABP8HP10_9BACT